VISRVLSIPAKRFDRRIVTFLTAEESVALIDAAPDNRWEGRRDRALLTLAIHAGLRVSELISVNRADIELGTGAHVRVEGKGRKQRPVPLTKDAQAVLAVWLDERAGLPDDPLFPIRTGQRLTRDAVEREDVPLAVELRDGGPGVTVQAVTSLAASSVRVGVVG
jgi:site-specific recombinase XerC